MNSNFMGVVKTYSTDNGGPDAVRLIISYLRENPVVWDDVLQDDVVMRSMIDQLVRGLRHEKRTAVKYLMRGDTEKMHNDRMGGQERSHQRITSLHTLLAYPTFSGKPLGECMADDLTDSIMARRSQAADQHRAANFEEAVRRQLPGGGVKVADVLTVENIQEAYDEAYE